MNALLHANKQALKGIQKSTQRNQIRNSGKDLIIPVGNHVLLRDHPEGRNKIQDRYKTDVYVVSAITRKNRMFITSTFEQ